MSEPFDLKIDIDLKEKIYFPVMCKQNDNINLIFNVYNNSVSTNLSNFDCRLRALKPDRKPLIQRNNISISNNIVTIILDPQLTTTSGMVHAELQLIEKTTNLKKHSFNISIRVISSVLEVDRTISRATYDLLTELEYNLDKVDGIEINWNRAEELNTSLIAENNEAVSNISSLKTENNKAPSNISNLKVENDRADTNIPSLKNENDNADDKLDKFRLYDTTNLIQQVQDNTTQLNDIPNQYVKKVTGKSLSTNDYDNTEKAEVAKVKNKADVTYVDAKIGNIGNTKTFKGSTVFASLPTTNNTNGDYYYVTDKTTNYCWNGSAWVDIGNNFNVADNTITPRKTSFLKSLNLFDGNYIHGKYLVGAGETIKTDPDYYLIALAVEPNTDYSIFIGNDTGKEDGYYWFKIGSATEDVNTILTKSNTQEVTLDGSVHFMQTSIYQAGQTITTGASDKSLFVLVSKYTIKNYVEVAKGSRTGSLYSSYLEGYKELGFWAYNKDEVYNKTEVYNKDEINNNNLNAFVKTGEICNITFANKSHYKFEHVTDGNANLNTWRLTKGTINNNILWEGTDIEGPLQEKGAADFIGGFHGDEIFESINILADGTVLNSSQNHNIKFNTLTVFVKSTLYRCNTTIPVFTRHKKLEFKNNELIVTNRLISLTDNFIISRYTGCGLYSVYKNLLSGYTVNTKPELITSGGLDNDINTDEGTFFGNGFLVNIKTLSGKTSNFKGSVADFSVETNPRYKLYLDCINSSTGVTVNKNDELNASFSIKIISNNA